MAEPPSRNAEFLKKVVGLLDDLLQEGKWDASLFMQKSGEQIKGYRDEAQAILDDITGVKEKKEAEAKAQAAGELMTVYVSVFQMDPNDMMAWQATLNSISEYSASRSIYLAEDHIKELIRSKSDPSREAYVEVTINKKDILTPSSGKPAVDKFEHEMVTVRQGAIKPDNIKRFVHRNKVYHFEDGRLQRIDEND